MKLGEKVKTGIEHCINSRPCMKCAYDGRDFPACFVRMGADALAYIRQLESKLAEYEKPLEPLTLVEVLHIPGCEENYPLYWLNRDGTGHWAMTFALGKGIDLAEPGTVEKIQASYGTDYLLFRKKPTDEERKAAKWDE